jgi:hypothetical protein
VLEPALLSDCTRVAGARAQAPRVQRNRDAVVVEFTAIDDEGHGSDHRVTIQDGRVRASAVRTWTAPSEEDEWGGLE